MRSEYPVDSLHFYDALAERMKDHPELFNILGDVDMDLALVIRRPQADPFCVLLSFSGIQCLPNEITEGEERSADCWLEGPLDAWQAMVDDIVTHGAATARWTINSLTLMGDRIVVNGADPLGTDRFFRFNQTVQEYFDGAASLAAANA